MAEGVCSPRVSLRCRLLPRPQCFPDATVSVCVLEAPAPRLTFACFFSLPRWNGEAGGDWGARKPVPQAALAEDTASSTVFPWAVAVGKTRRVHTLTLLHPLRDRSQISREPGQVSGGNVQGGAGDPLQLWLPGIPRCRVGPHSASSSSSKSPRSVPPSLWLQRHLLQVGRSQPSSSVFGFLSRLQGGTLLRNLPSLLRKVIDFQFVCLFFSCCKDSSDEFQALHVLELNLKSWLYLFLYFAQSVSLYLLQDPSSWSCAG